MTEIKFEIKSRNERIWRYALEKKLSIRFSEEKLKSLSISELAKLALNLDVANELKKDSDESMQEHDL